MGWCNDIYFQKNIIDLFKYKKNLKSEKLKRKDYKYDLLIPN